MEDAPATAAASLNRLDDVGCEYEGTTIVRKVWNGRANLLGTSVDGQSVTSKP